MSLVYCQPPELSFSHRASRKRRRVRLLPSPFPPPSTPNESDEADFFPSLCSFSPLLDSNLIASPTKYISPRSPPLERMSQGTRFPCDPLRPPYHFRLALSGNYGSRDRGCPCDARAEKDSASRFSLLLPSTTSPSLPLPFPSNLPTNNSSFDHDAIRSQDDEICRHHRSYGQSNLSIKSSPLLRHSLTSSLSLLSLPSLVSSRRLPDPTSKMFSR